MSQNEITSRLGQWVLRTEPKGKPRPYQLYKPEDPANEYKVISLYMWMISKGFTFKPMLTIHSSVEESSCTACEG